MLLLCVLCLSRNGWGFKVDWSGLGWTGLGGSEMGINLAIYTILLFCLGGVMGRKGGIKR